jgi:hypothetical protein
MPAPRVDYERHGAAYSRHRRADPRQSFDGALRLVIAEAPYAADWGVRSCAR